MQPAPFVIDIPQSDLDLMKGKLRETRWADDFGNADWKYGMPADWLKDMTEYWLEGFDWRQHEAAMNAYDHFKVVIDDVPIHYLRVPGKGPNSTPLILTHGWPWTFWDWKDVIRPLSDPASHGGEIDNSFDLIIPSLPGFGFSVPLRTTGLGAREIAALWVKLMRDVLGYPRFAAAGGDWGALITSELGHAHAEHLIGIYLTLPYLPGMRPAALIEGARGEFADDEAWMAARMQEVRPHVTSHVAVQLHDPQTLAWALADSPVGTAAWIWERRRNWSDCDGTATMPFDRDFLCVNASIYWLTNTIGSSLRIYAEHFSRPWLPIHDRTPMIPVPTGLGVMPRDIVMMPRGYMEQHTNLRRYTILSRGGHFAPVENPQEVAGEMRAFFATLKG
jgi:pimeloyl-ACP methyl ester carboxylesterase